MCYVSKLSRFPHLFVLSFSSNQNSLSKIYLRLFPVHRVYVSNLLKTLRLNIQDTIDNVTGYVVAQLIEALRYKPEGRGFDPRWCHFIDRILLAALWS